jgi:hypothetical protein
VPQPVVQALLQTSGVAVVTARTGELMRESCGAAMS